ncbi:EAL domain-containing protein [Acidovorax sp. A1169]|uniref:bifunctional diguanylate cyclase/phosphodiesterase n=1 Tax=Acidovorax sp. A1169 TaxID=3059524 RepID=UPI0027378384|nr:EAL domain-containing protein [Acidovorax sp. A1169]MDP4074323.1 EAL domain-containing protein [Acidovorax sp. A1169]
MRALPPLATGSLSARIRLLILVATLPALVLVAYQARANRDEALAAARENALLITRTMAYSQQSLIDTTRTFLQQLATTRRAQQLDAPDCSQYLAEVLALNATYVNIGLPRADGDLLCSAVPLRAPVNVTNRPYFLRAIVAREFSVGVFQVDKAVGVASVNFAQPVIDPETRAVLGAAVAVVSLDWWSRRLHELGLPEGAVARVLDPDGRVIARFPPDPQELGTQPELPRAGAGAQAVQGGATVLETHGDAPYIEVARPLLESQGRPVATMRLSMPLDALYARTTQQMWRDIGFLLLGLLASFVLAHEGVRRGVGKPLARLLRATDQLAQGQQVAAVPETGFRELAQLAQRFNHMAQARQQAEGELRQSEENLAITLHSIGDAVVATDHRGLVVRMNGVAEQMTGWPLREAQGRPLTDIFRIVNAHTREPSKDPVQLVMASGQVVELSNHTTLIARGGTEYQIADSAAPIRNAAGDITGVVLVFSDVTESYSVRRQLEDNEARFRTLTMLSSDWYWEQDAQMRFVTLEGEAARRTLPGPQWHVGKTRREVATDDGGGVAASDGIAVDWEQHEQTLREHREFRDFEYPRHSTGGAVEWVSVSGTPMFGADGTFLGYRGIGNNITERKNAERELRIAAIAFESQEGMLVTDADTVILRTNRAFTKITGYDSADAVGRRASFLASGQHDEAFFASLRRTLDSAGEWSGEIWNRCKDGQVNLHQMGITAVKDAQGRLTHYVASLSDITQKAAAAREIEHLAFYDPLTLLPNRRLMMDRLQQAFASSARSGQYGALLCLDLDHFKTLNDTLGHDMGDVLLQQVAQRLKACVREGDTVARLGGDEFLLLLKGMSSEPTEAAEHTQGVGNKILEALNQPYQLAMHHVHSTPSIGAVLFSGQSQSVDELMKRADLAMYAAKTAGRNAVRFFDPRMQAAVTARAAMENDLRTALAEDQFRLYYQVQVGQGARAIGAEVLIRWQHPERGLVMPGEFIPLAEETGQILAIGLWVLRTACRQLRQWQDDPARSHLQLAVNVSARQFRQGDFVDHVFAVLSETGARADHLKLELTESMALDNVQQTIARMNALRALGVGFSMDDFGTGQSSLSYLTRLPLDQLKIDQSFVRNIGIQQTDALIVQTIIGMAQSLGIDVIAEGVETTAQREFLAQHGCNLWQGYLFSRPVPLENFEQLMAQRYAVNP